MGAKRVGVALVAVLSLAPTGSGAGAPNPVTYSIDGTPGTNNWYRGSPSGNFVILHWFVNSPPVNTSGCEPAIKINGPTAGTTKTCTAEFSDGSKYSVTVTVKVDAEPPTGVSAVADRPPDAHGWYNHPLFVRWQGGDATSGIAGCTVVTYRGPNVKAGQLSGGCTDRAGNSAFVSFPLKYDGRHPRVKALGVQSEDGRNVVRWRSSSKGDVAVIKRIARGSRRYRTVFHGPGTRFVDRKIRDGAEYRYFVQTLDQAANASKTRSVLALPKVITFGIGYTPSAATPPILRWGHTSGADYYHVQLFRAGQRILAAWPAKAQLALRARWIWNGHRYRLTPGRYAWYAWAGLGARAAAHYRPVGHAVFIIPGR